jgi:hypothetical protein
MPQAAKNEPAISQKTLRKEHDYRKRRVSSIRSAGIIRFRVTDFRVEGNGGYRFAGCVDGVAVGDGDFGEPRDGEASVVPVYIGRLAPALGVQFGDHQFHRACDRICIILAWSTRHRLQASSFSA